MRFFSFVFVAVGFMMLFGGMWGMFGNESDYCEDFDCSEIQAITEQEDETKYMTQMGALTISGAVLLVGGVVAEGLSRIEGDGDTTKQMVSEIKEAIAQRRQKS